MRETGWIDDIFHDFMKDSTYHLEDNLPHLAEVIAEESERLAGEEKKKIIMEILDDLKGMNYQMTIKKVRYVNIDGLVEKWEAKE